MTTTETYKRGQVEWALWRCASHMHNAGAEPPKVFLTRIKRLLEVDRADRGVDGFCAFADAPTDGQGTDAAFTVFDGFCLALALELLDAGFKQSEIVFLIRNIRDPLRVEFDRIMENPPPSRGRIRAEKKPDMPSYDHKEQRWADYRVFALIRKVEMTEVFPALSRGSHVGTPVILEPTFCRGIEDLQATLNELGSAFRKAMVLEIAAVAALIADFLPHAPLTRRGRQ
jgi:hypothetical protein